MDTMTRPKQEVLLEDPSAHELERVSMRVVRNGSARPSTMAMSPPHRRRGIITATLGVAGLVIASALLADASGVAAGTLVAMGVWLARYWGRHSR